MTAFPSAPPVTPGGETRPRPQVRALLLGLGVVWGGIVLVAPPRLDAARTLDPKGQLVSSRQSEVYHDPDCPSAKRLKPENRVVHASFQVAEARGLRECRICRPSAAAIDATVRRIARIALRPGPMGQEDDPEPSSDDPLRFSRDIAPILVANCLRCHNDDRSENEFNLSTYQDLIDGSASGLVVLAGDPDGSELIRRVKGQSRPRMPPGNNDPLANETIDRLADWIRAGAKLDEGVEPTAPLTDIAPSLEELQRAALASLPDDQRHERLAEIAARRWVLATPGETPRRTTSERVLVFSRLPEDRAERVGRLLDQAVATLRGLLSRPDRPALDSPVELSVFVLNDRRSYVEFIRSVANSEPKSAERGRAKLSGEAPYVVAFDPAGGRETEENDRRLEAILVEALTQGAVRDASDKAPEWLALGLGAYFGAQIDPNGVGVGRLRAEVLERIQLGWTDNATQALGDQGDAETIRALGYSLIDWLSNAQKPKVPPFVRGMLDGGDKLDDGIQYLFGTDRRQFLLAWGQWAASRYSRRGR